LVVQGKGFLGEKVNPIDNSITYFNNNAHSGRHSISKTLNAGGSFRLAMNDLTLEAGKRYFLSLWIKEGQIDPANISFSLDQGVIGVNETGYTTTFTALQISGQAQDMENSGSLIEGWRRIAYDFTVSGSSSAKNIFLKVQNNEASSLTISLDDVLVLPYEASVNMFAYDLVSLKLLSQLDENGFATHYDYDPAGNLYQVRKETEKGIKTIQHTVQNIPDNYTTPVEPN
jgi:hypothetical protein